MVIVTLHVVCHCFLRSRWLVWQLFHLFFDTNVNKYIQQDFVEGKRLVIGYLYLICTYDIVQACL